MHLHFLNKNQDHQCPQDHSSPKLSCGVAPRTLYHNAELWSRSQNTVPQNWTVESIPEKLSCGKDPRALFPKAELWSQVTKERGMCEEKVI